jgi:hypothetical protein
VHDGDLDAGDFTTWLRGTRVALTSARDVDVPCDGCVACCTSSQFVHIDPDEHDTLAHVPRALLFPAPGLPAGHLVLGYDERGHCPMLVDGRCSIYEHRPRTCRTYDCRVFAATGVEPDKPAIAQRVARWRFTVVDGEARAAYEALRASAESVDGRNATERAVRALRRDGGGRDRPLTLEEADGRAR